MVEKRLIKDVASSIVTLSGTGSKNSQQKIHDLGYFLVFLVFMARFCMADWASGR